jgi:hypothetical protein
MIARLTMPPAFFKRVNETRFKQEWLLTPLQYLALKLGWDGHGSPKFQRGMLSGLSVKRAITAGGAGFVRLNPHTLLDERFDAGTAAAEIQFQNDGQLFAFRQVGSDFEYNGEWWSDEEEASIGDGYECRHLSSGKNGTYNGPEAAVADTWITITTGRSWGVTRTVNGMKSCDATFECGLDGVESALDSATFTVTASVDIL